MLSVALFCVSSCFAGIYPAWGRQAMVTSADQYATEVGIRVLRDGGNAIDAAAATALALGVTEGLASGIGGGCFVLIRMADGTAVAVEGRETAPAAASRDMYVQKDSTDPADLSLTGPLSAGVPGELAALEHVVRTFGTRPFGELFDGAIALADTGFVIGLRYDANLKKHVDRLRRFESSRDVFFRQDSIPLGFGDRLRQPDLANTMRRLQSHGVSDFYQGELARSIASACSEYGGIISLEDLAGYKVETHQPVSGTFRGYDILSMPLPSSGGVHVIQILNLVEPFQLKPLGFNSSASIHLIAEAMQAAFADRAEFMGDPKFTTEPVAGLLSKEYAAKLRLTLDTLNHQRRQSAGNPGEHAKESMEKHTTNICAVDSAGNAVVITATVNIPFGSAFVVPGTGIILNDQMDDFVTSPGKPNFYGLVGMDANAVAPGKRPLSSMSPTILLKNGEPFMAVGSQGGPRIISSVVLTILNVLEYGLNLQQAVDAPRVHQQWVPDQLFLEPEHPQDVVDKLMKRGHNVDNLARWSTVTAIMADSARSAWWGASDGRAQGLAKGY